MKNKSILISIQPQWVEKILNGEKNIEIRKTMPKCELPVKVYIYCSLGREVGFEKRYCNYHIFRPDKTGFGHLLNGKVVAEFTLNKVKEYSYVYSPAMLMQGYYTKKGKELDYSKCCLKLHEIEKYADDGQILPKPIYAWHIDNLKIYDKPKELSEFSGFIPNNRCEKHENGFACDKCDAYDKEHNTCLALYYCRKPIKRPPQSWCYVEVADE